MSDIKNDLKLPLFYHAGHRTVNDATGKKIFRLRSAINATAIVEMVNGHGELVDQASKMQSVLDHLAGRGIIDCGWNITTKHNSLTAKLAQETKMHSEVEVENIKLAERIRIAEKALGNLKNQIQSKQLINMSTTRQDQDNNSQWAKGWDDALLIMLPFITQALAEMREVGK